MRECTVAYTGGFANLSGIMSYLHFTVDKVYFALGPETYDYAFGDLPGNARAGAVDGVTETRVHSLEQRRLERRGAERHGRVLRDVVSASIEPFFESRDAEGRRAPQ